MAYFGLEFAAAFPADEIERGEGDDWEIVRPGGMAMSIAIVDLLRSIGFPATIPEPDLEHYCWVFEVEKGGRHLVCCCYVIPGEPEFIMVQGSSPMFKRLFNRPDPYIELLRSLDGLLNGDPRFASVQWIDLNRKPIAAL